MTNHFVELNHRTASKFVILTAASRNHFNESRDCVASAQFYFPGKVIVYYDLGLTESQVEKVNKFLPFWPEHEIVISQNISLGKVNGNSPTSD